MKKIALLLIFFASIGCQTKKIDVKNLDKNGKVIVQFARQACFGKCPIYNFSIYENGLLVYNGERFVEKEGTFYQLLPKSVVKDLISEFEKSSFSTFAEKYPVDNTSPADLSSVELSYRNKAGALKKVIAKGWGAPEEFIQLHLRVDSLLSFQQMTKI